VGAAARVAALDAPALFVPAAVAAWADAELAALPPVGVEAAQLLTERAAISGYVSRGAISAGGTCRLLDAADGGIALNLARDDDWVLLPAWLECDVAPHWEAVLDRVRERPARALVERGREIGLAVAVDEMPVASAVGGASAPTGSGLKPLPQPVPNSCANARPPRVIDLSSLWAGPLCGHLLQRLGAEVIKVESVRRPDGARRGPPLFFDLLNAGKASVALDFATAQGRAQLEALLESADIVIEASRPRALRQLGIDARAFSARRPELIWIGITAYGRTPLAGSWIGYGDDVGVAAGFSAVLRAETGARGFAGDALADPLTGISAARQAWQAWQAGAGGLLDVSLYATSRRCLAATKEGRTPLSIPLIRKGGSVRIPGGNARPLGADTDAVLRALDSSNRGRQRLAPAARLVAQPEEAR